MYRCLFSILSSLRFSQGSSSSTSPNFSLVVFGSVAFLVFLLFLLALVAGPWGRPDRFGEGCRSCSASGHVSDGSLGSRVCLRVCVTVALLVLYFFQLPMRFLQESGDFIAQQFAQWQPLAVIMHEHACSWKNRKNRNLSFALGGDGVPVVSVDGCVSTGLPEYSLRS